jgi:hypothetical protein
MADTPEWRQQLQQLQGRLEQLAVQQIQSWAERWDHTFRQQANLWRSTGHEWREIDRWGRGPVLTFVPKDPQHLLADQRQAIDGLQRTREWLAEHPIEDVQARLQQSAERAREALQQSRMSREPRAEERQTWDAGDPDYLGWQAEQRFYAEQDPTSQWYRADLYHGEPGPDVAIDLAEEEMRRREQELEFARQELAFDEAQIRRAAGEPLSAADVDNWEHPFDWPTQAEQQAYEDRPYDLMEERAHGSDSEDGEWGARPEDAPEYVVIDTTKPEMEESFQALLDRLDQRLDALVKETDTETQQLQQKQGVRY